MTAQLLSPKRVLFAPAAGDGLGGGHVLRCLTLAEALIARGASCAFAVNDAGAALMTRFAAENVVFQRASVAQALAVETFDVVVLDDYAVAADDERKLRCGSLKIVAIDDLADRPHLADLIVDPGYARRAADYANLSPENRRLLIGPAYALVKRAFGDRRAAALARPTAPRPARLFVSFGLSDVGGVAARAVAAIRAQLPELWIDVALASDAQSVAGLQARAGTDSALQLHLDTTDVANLMASADLAIGAGGASTWERACLGLPTLAVIVADNQRHMIRGLAADGALLAADLDDPLFDQTFCEALMRLCDPIVREALRSASSTLCDGLGADRVAEEILTL